MQSEHPVCWVQVNGWLLNSLSEVPLEASHVTKATRNARKVRTVDLLLEIMIRDLCVCTVVLDMA